MALTPGARLGVYEVTAQIGEGGMGQVYRARDTTLHRDVALKFLPDAFASDPDRLARFTREAQTLASLNHPNIAHIHGLEESGGVRAIVMELVEGEDLSQRIARGALPLDEALPIAKQVAEALEAAHELGIIHRDLKPANIKVRPDGTVKVLDFGLAKGIEPVVRVSNVSQSPTITSPAMMTGVGVMLGTAAYMAPEQAKGRPADKRCDIWAFGCVLFEMLTGRRPFDGEDMTEVLGAVVRLEPPWAALPSDVPPPIRTLLQSCLVKDPRHRVADISTALFVLDQSASLAAPVGTTSAPAVPRTAWWRRLVMPATAAFVTSAVVGATVWLAMRPIPPRVSRLTITPTPATALSISGNQLGLAITPDGTRVIYVGNNGTQLFVRALDALEPAAVFTGRPFAPFVSPDGQQIGFVDETTLLKKVAVTGGPAVPLTTLDGLPRGAAWDPEGTIIIATSNLTTGLQRVSAAGGPTTTLTRPDRAQGELDHLWPEMLPDGRGVLFTITALAGGLDAAQVVVQNLQTGARRVLARGGSHAHYISSGHLVYAAAGTLRGVAFDLARLETRGAPVPVIPDVMTTLNGGVSAVVAGNGTMVHVSGRAEVFTPRTLVWVDRFGREAPIQAPPRAYVYPRLSPDGTRAAVVGLDQEVDLWIWNLGSTTLTRATFDPAIDHAPVWTPDGERLIFSSERAGAARNLFWQAAGAAGAVERLTESPNVQIATAVSPDGRRLIFTETAQKTGQDVMQLELAGTDRATSLVQTPFLERNGIVSTDGRWLAYEANDSGRFEIYVRPFPEVTGGHWQVSTAGGTRPLWTPSGQELIYVSPSGALMRVGVVRGASWSATTPTQLVKEGYLTTPAIDTGRTYDIAPDGQRFLMIKAERPAAPASLIVVQHWVDELKRLVPPK